MIRNALTFLLLILGSDMRAEAQQPMSCKIQGQIISIIKLHNEDSGSVCFKYPCRAKVKIIQASACGSSVTLALHPDDIIEMRFEYTLHDTKKLFPGMKAHFPGLKIGDTFTASALQRLRPGTKGEFVIYDYRKQKK